MPNVTIKRLLLVAVSIFSMWNAGAEPIRCDTCTTSEDFRAQAVARGPGTHLVYNITNNTVEQYKVGPVTEDGSDGVQAAVPAAADTGVPLPGPEGDEQSPQGATLL